LPQCGRSSSEPMTPTIMYTGNRTRVEELDAEYNNMVIRSAKKMGC
jgi:hypothetical protein